MPFIRDPNLNKFAIDTSQYPDVTEQLIGYMKGHRVNVTYYRLLNNEGFNNRTNIGDIPNARNITATEYQKIVGLEITLTKGFDFTASQERGGVSMSGQAMFYPNMNPRVGDMFLMGVGDGRVGLCRVSRVEPMTWRTDRIFSVNFIVQEFLEHAISDQLEACVTLVSYFSKENYLGGTAALLSEQSYLQLAKIRDQRIILCRNFHHAFFQSTIHSYVRPDGVYDPWVVLFMCGKLRMEDVPARPKNLIGQQRADYERTIWGRLEDEHNNTMQFLLSAQQLRGYNQTRMGAFVTELHNRQIVYPVTPGSGLESYIFSSNFYNGQTQVMTELELLIYEAITRKTSGPLTSLILEHLDPVYSLSLADQFYKIPLCIHLIDMALRSQYREIDAPSMNYAQNQDA